MDRHSFQLCAVHISDNPVGLLEDLFHFGHFTVFKLHIVNMIDFQCFLEVRSANKFSFLKYFTGQTVHFNNQVILVLPAS